MTVFAPIAAEKYLSLETYRRSGTAVRTPVWFAAGDETGSILYVYTGAQAGKTKRLRRDNRARIAACNMAGRVTGPWIAVRASVVTGAEADLGMRLLNRKYWPWKQILNLASRFGGRPERAVIAIRPAENA